MNKKKTRSSGGGSGGGLANRDRPGSSGSLNRQSTPTSSASKDKEQPEYLGYNMDQRVTYISSSIIGTIVSIELDDGVIYEGVFRTFSPEFELTISQMHKVDPKDPTRIDPETVKETGVFNMNRIVRLSALDVDLNAAKEGFLTDAQIGNASKINGERDLEMWMPDGDEDNDISLDLGTSASANGWDAEDMFKANEQNYGVRSTYKSNLEGYTIQLKTDKNSDDYRKMEAIAAAKAQEIEGSTTNKLAIELENGDEEEAFSAVVRTTNNNRGDDDSGKYVAPARRGQPSSRNNNATPSRGQQGSPMSRGDDRGQRGRREYQGSSPASAHPGREQHYRGGYARGGGGASNRGGRGGGPFKGDPRGGPGGKSHRDGISGLKQFKDNFHLNTNEGGKQPSPPTAVQSRNSPHDRKGASPPNKVEPQRKASPPTASIINRQESVEQRTPTPAKTPPTVVPTAGVPGAGGPTTPSTATAAGPTATGVPHPPPSTTPINVTKSKLNPNAKEFVLNPKAKEFVPPSARPSVGQTPPPQRPITPATPTGSMPMPMPGYYPNIPFSQAGAAGFPYIASVPGGAPGAHSYLYAPTSQPPPHPQHYGQQQRFRGSGPPASQAGSRGDANNPVLAATGQPLLSPQNNFATLIPPNLHMPPQGLHQQHQNPHQQQQQIAMAHGSMVPVSGGPPVMVRPMDASGAQSLPAWVQSNQPPPQMGGPPHPPPTGTPTSANQPPLPATPPTSGGVPPPSNHPQGGGPAGHQPQMGHVNGGHAAANAAGMYNLIPGSMQHAHHFPQQFQIPQQLLLQPGQTSLIQQPIMTQQGQPVTSIASGMPQFPYVSHHAGVIPAQQSSPQFIIAPHPMAVAGNQAAGGPGAAANAAANQMQPPPQ